MEITSYEIFTSFFIFLLGTSLASFFGLLSYRVNRDYNLKGILMGRSQCDNCHQELRWFELIPVLGWMITKGNCMRCGQKITMLYPIYELVLGVIFVLFFLTNQPVYFYPVLCFLYLFSLSDMEFMAIPQTFVHTGLIYAFALLVYMFVTKGDTNSIVLGIIVSATITLVNYFKKSFGVGDLLIILMISFVLPIESFIIFLFASIVLGGVISAMLVAFDKKWLKQYLPFVPFLLLGFIFTVIVNL
jgi:leader peptidase (prepilin peptidase)/N-methyltransferase